MYIKQEVKPSALSLTQFIYFASYIRCRLKGCLVATFLYIILSLSLKLLFLLVEPIRLPGNLILTIPKQ